MRVERGQHAVDRSLDQCAFVDLFDVVGAYALENVAEQVELLVHRGVARLFLGEKRPGHLGAEDNATCEAPDCRHDQLVHMHGPSCVLRAVRPRSGGFNRLRTSLIGSTVRPACLSSK
jgi:hypothetical protein